MKNLKLTLIALISFLTLTSFAQTEAISAAPISQKFEGVIHQELLKEYPLEVRSFDQTKEPKEVVEAFTQDWDQFLKSGQLSTKWMQGYSWSSSLKAYIQPAPLSTRPVLISDLVSIRPEVIDVRDHSISDPLLYSAERVGMQIVRVLQKEKLKALIYGGDSETVAAAFSVAPEMIHFLPSTYEAWGLRKGFISGKAFADHKPRYLFVVPPSTQYLIHYAELFQVLGIEVQATILNKRDQNRQIANLQKAFRDLKAQLPAAVDVVSLGYYRNFQNAVGPAGIMTKEIKMGEGLTAQLVEDTEANPRVRYLLVKSDLTIWGESTAFVAQGALELQPSAILFMGSAGGMTPKSDLYGVTIPSVFELEGKKLSVRNEIFETLNTKGYAVPGVALGLLHGHTNSPIEETLDYVSERIDTGMDTLDVETNLVAELIGKHNRATGSKVLFAAVNLITDKPKSWRHVWEHQYDLSVISSSKKEEARKKAVRSAIDGFRESLRLRHFGTPLRSVVGE